MAKMGRPPLEEPMFHKVSVRFSKREYRRLKAGKPNPDNDILHSWTMDSRGTAKWQQ